jgi:hypothetical protein
MMTNASKIDRPNSRFRHVYAIVSIDSPLNLDEPENSVAVVKVLASRKTADVEAMRLNEINGDKGCSYVVRTSRFMP